MSLDLEKNKPNLNYNFFKNNSFNKKNKRKELFFEIIIGSLFLFYGILHTNIMNSIHEKNNLTENKNYSLIPSQNNTKLGIEQSISINLNKNN